MAIPFIVEDGTGVVGATSYLTLAEADDILSLNSVSYAAWSGIGTSSDQENSLVWASRYIDQYVDWNGHKHVEESGLRWPRDCVYDTDGVMLSNSTVPEQVKRAVAQLSVFLVSSQAARTGGQSSVLPEGIKRVQADVVEVEFFEDGSASSRTGSDLLPVNMRFLVRGLGKVITGRQNMARVIR